MARSSARQDLIDTALEIAEEYAADDLLLTVRQIYYQFVRRFPDRYPSSMETYKRIQSALSEARYTGEFPIDMIEDRGREVRPGHFTVCQSDVDDAFYESKKDIAKLPNMNLWMHKWYGQRTHVSVWVEKDALTGIFEDPCNQQGVSWFACKGYPSVSALWHYIKLIDEANDSHPDGGYDNAVVLYFGDHDPDGLEIPDAASRSINRLSEALEDKFSNQNTAFMNIEFKRVALTMAQIKQHKPPPFPAKETSARFAEYQRKTGLSHAWELDALKPRALRDLIDASVSPYFDFDTYSRYKSDIDSARLELKRKLCKDGLMKSIFPDV